MTHRTSFARRGVIVWLLLAASLVALTGCGDKEPEQRRAFLSYLNDTVLRQQGSLLPNLTREQEKSFGDYTDHYAVLTDFQKAMSAGTAKNARDLLDLAEMENLADVAKAEPSLRKAAREAEKLQRLVLELKDKTDKSKAKLSLPEDLAPVYDAVYEKTVALPAETSAAAFSAVYAAFSATLDLLDFIGTHNHDLKIADGNINIYNQAVEPELKNKMAAVRATSAQLRKAYAAMMKAMLQ